MSRLIPLPWQKLVCVFEQIGYKYAGQKGSPIKLEKAGVARPLIVPKYDAVGRDIITGLGSPARLSWPSWKIASAVSLLQI